MFLKLLGAAKGVLIRAAASTQTLCRIAFEKKYKPARDLSLMDGARRDAALTNSLAEAVWAWFLAPRLFVSYYRLTVARYNLGRHNKSLNRSASSGALSAGLS